MIKFFSTISILCFLLAALRMIGFFDFIITNDIEFTICVLLGFHFMLIVFLIRTHSRKVYSIISYRQKKNDFILNVVSVVGTGVLIILFILKNN